VSGTATLLIGDGHTDNRQTGRSIGAIGLSARNTAGNRKARGNGTDQRGVAGQTGPELSAIFFGVGLFFKTGFGQLVQFSDRSIETSQGRSRLADFLAQTRQFARFLVYPGIARTVKTFGGNLICLAAQQLRAQNVKRHRRLFFRLAIGVNQHRDVFDKLVIDGGMNIFFPGGFAFD